MATIQWLKSFMPLTCTYGEDDKNITVAYLDKSFNISKSNCEDMIKEVMSEFLRETKDELYSRNSESLIDIGAIYDHARELGIKIEKTVIKSPISYIVVNGVEFYFFNSLYDYGFMIDVKNYIVMKEKMTNMRDMLSEVGIYDF